MKKSKKFTASRITMGFACTCLVIWGITQRGGDDDNGGYQNRREPSDLHRPYNDGIPYFFIEPEEVQLGEVFSLAETQEFSYFIYVSIYALLY